MIKFLISLFLFSILQKIRSIEFEFDLIPKYMECFGEQLTENTLMIGEIKSNQINLIVNVYDPNGKNLLLKSNETIIKFSITTLISGTYQICIENTSRQILKVAFNLKSGIFAKDYSALAKKKNVKPMEILIKKMEDLSKELQKNGQFVLEQKEEKMNSLENIITKIVSFSVFSIIVLFLLAIIQSTYLKKFFKTKKLI